MKFRHSTQVVVIGSLDSKQRAELRSRAHKLKPAQHVGKDGVTEAVLSSIDEALNTRDLLKIRVLDNAPGSPREMAEEIAAARDNVQVVQVVGRVAVLYRPLEE